MAAVHTSQFADVLHEARFVLTQEPGELPVECSSVLISCFRVDGELLLLQRHPPDGAWDLPHGAVPQSPHSLYHLGLMGARLVYVLSGVLVAEVPALYGYIDWGSQAIRAGWHATACLAGEVGTIDPLPTGSWAERRAFLPPLVALEHLPTDPWGDLRRTCLAAAIAGFDAGRNYWLLQPRDSLAAADPGPEF